MILNPDKFQVIVLGKCKPNNTEVKLLLVQKKFQLYHQLAQQTQCQMINSNLHIDKTCLLINSVDLLGQSIFKGMRKKSLKKNFCSFKIQLLLSGLYVSKWEILQVLSFMLINNGSSYKVCIYKDIYKELGHYVQKFTKLLILNPKFLKNLIKVCKTNRTKSRQYQQNFEIQKFQLSFFCY